MAQFKDSNSFQATSMGSGAFISFGPEHNIGHARPEDDDFLGDTPRATELSSSHSDCHLSDAIRPCPQYLDPVSSDHRSHSVSSMPAFIGYKHTYGGLEDAHSGDMWQCPNPYGGCEVTYNPSWHTNCPICGAAKPT